MRPLPTVGEEALAQLTATLRRWKTKGLRLLVAPQ